MLLKDVIKNVDKIITINRKLKQTDNANLVSHGFTAKSFTAIDNSVTTSNQTNIFPTDEELLGDDTNNHDNNKQNAEINEDKELRSKKTKQNNNI